MVKLIMADIKVLGHRIWAIPVGIFLFIMMFSFIPYLEQVQAFQNWIFAILIPGLLTYELFREEQRRNTSSVLMTMPISKEEYVWAKYSMVLIFGLIAVIIGIISNSFMELNYEMVIPKTGLLSYGYDFINPVIWALKFILFVLPIYFFSKKLKSSIVASILATGVFLDGYFSFYYKYFYVFFVDGKISKFYLSVFVTLIIISVLLLVGKITFKNIKKDILLSGWYAGLLYLSVVTYQLLMEHLNFFSSILWYLKIKDNPEVSIERVKHIENIISSYYTFTGFLLLLLLIFIRILMYIRKNTKDEFYQNIVIFLFLPIIFITAEGNLFNFLREIFPQAVTHNPDTTSYPLFKIPMLVGLITFVIISARSSIYLLKNNRTLK